MVIGNFSLLVGFDFVVVNEWYLLVYVDVYEWVEMFNVSGMILFVDGGKFVSKFYVVSGQYINCMLDYCKNCGYFVLKKIGFKVCLFNYLYWDFFIKYQDKLVKNFCMVLIYKSLGCMFEDNIVVM